MNIEEYTKTVNPNATLGEYLRYAKDNDPKEYEKWVGIYTNMLFNNPHIDTQENE